VRVSEAGRAESRALLTREPNDGFRDYVSAGGDDISPGFGEATRERDRLFLASVGTDTGSLATFADFDAERDRGLRVSIASDFPSASADVATAAGVTGGIACGVALRPNPSALAIVDRRSE
jgi:hypothetical protein